MPSLKISYENNQRKTIESEIDLPQNFLQRLLVLIEKSKGLTAEEKASNYLTSILEKIVADANDAFLGVKVNETIVAVRPIRPTVQKREKTT